MVSFSGAWPRRAGCNIHEIITGQPPRRADRWMVEGFQGVGPGAPGNGDEAGAEDARRCFSFLRGVPILLELDEHMLWQLAQVAREQSFAPGELVVSQGEDDPQKNFYVVRSGTADVLRRDPAGMERTVARLACGSYFGELGLLTNQARNASVRVHGDTPLRVFVFDALAFHRLIAENVLVFRLTRQQRQTRREQRPPRLRIRELDVLRAMDAPDLEYVLAAAEHRWYPAGSAVFDQGDDGDRFYIVLDGSFDVERDGDVIATIEPGGFFGETALLFDMQRTATIRARSNALAWSITRSAFQRVVGHYLLSQRLAQATIMRRVRGLM
jgi:cAMP-dependent protein kinase regulator